MPGGEAWLIAVALICVLLFLAAWVWWRLGWARFEYTTGQSPAWAAPPGGDISRLRFRDCTFSVLRADGGSASTDVSAVLNAMSAAFKTAAAGSRPDTLRLDAPLNAFSFTIRGFNDRATVHDPAAPPWCSAPRVACGGGACPGGTACGPDGLCPLCPGAPGTSLTGYWRFV